LGIALRKYAGIDLFEKKKGNQLKKQIKATKVQSANPMLTSVNQS
jgi:hypothetical protein